MAILETLGGENEKQRAKELLDKCTLVADQPSIRSQNLPHTGKIRERSKVINIWENCRDNQEWTIQRHSQYWQQDTGQMQRK